MRELVASAQRVLPRRRALALAALCLLAVAYLGTDLREVAAPAEEEPRGEAREPVLSGEPSANARAEAGGREDAPSTSARRSRPVVVEALAPGELPRSAAPTTAGPPERILRENAKLRRELRHLRALEAERRRVARALAAAGIVDTGALVGSGRLVWPITGPLTSPFGQRWGRLHAGVDISAPAGTPIRAADSGRVALAGWQGGYGLYTCVKHTVSLSTCYAHQSKLGTRAGAAVRQGDIIGYVGNTGQSFGNHLHFETWVSGRPVDPMGFL